jgi:hypothetical protein
VIHGGGVWRASHRAQESKLGWGAGVEDGVAGGVGGWEMGRRRPSSGRCCGWGEGKGVSVSAFSVLHVNDVVCILPSKAGHWAVLFVGRAKACKHGNEQHKQQAGNIYNS